MKKKKVKRLTERQAWLVVAAMFQYPAQGMCVAAVRLEGEGLLSEKIARKMRARIDHAMRRNRDMLIAAGHPDFLFPPRDTMQSNSLRIMFARAAAQRAKS